MPKRKNNAIFLDFLQEMRDSETPDSNKYIIYNKAINSLKKEIKEYATPDALLEVKFIGPSICGKLKKKWKELEAGSDHAMAVIPSNLPSPAKRKRTSNAASSSSQPKKKAGSSKRLLFQEDEDEVPAPKCRAGPSLGREGQYNNAPGIANVSQIDMPSIFSPPSYPLEIPPQPYHPFGHPKPSIAHHLPAQQFGMDHQYHRYTDHAHHLPAVAEAARLISPDFGHAIPPHVPSFNFYYIDAAEKRVRNREVAAVEIHDNTQWYKLCFHDSDAYAMHPLREQLRLVPRMDRKGKRRQGIVEAWVMDQDVEQYGLDTAPGFTDAEEAMDLDLDASLSAIKSQNTSHYKVQRAGNALVIHDGVRLPDASQESLADMLKAESKKKKITIDPARVIDVDRQWEARRTGLSSGSGKDAIKIEANSEYKAEADTAGISMRQRLALAAMARQQASALEQPSGLSTQPVSSSSGANLAIHKPQTLPGASGNDQHIPQTRGFDSFPTAAALDAGLMRTVTALNSLPSAQPVKPKPKTKGRVRGRVSEFAPALPAVDEFDADLDREAAGHRANVTQHASTSHASADLIDDVTDLTFEAAPSFPAFNPIVFGSDSYDIILILDNREIKSHNNRDYIVSELRKNSVNVEQRSLALGDVLWIARRRFGIPGAEDDECVLNYILERKRLDDLCGSIKDGRFHEQKFRLSNTALKVFYLIEAYDVEKNRESFRVQIDTARSSTQVVDGFIVKETKKLRYTIDYLAAMHQTIVEIHAHKPLYVIPPPLIKRHSYMALQKHLRQSQPTVGYLTNYTTFETLNSKSANLTTRDLLAQMLLCVKGLSAQKAAVIIDNYPTLHHLWDAFRVAEAVERAAEAARQGKGRGKKNTVPLAKAMLCGLEGSGRKHIGPALSEGIYRLMRANVYEES